MPYFENSAKDVDWGMYIDMDGVKINRCRLFLTPSTSAVVVLIER